MHIETETHPLLLARAFRTSFPDRLGDVDATPLAALLSADAPAPLQREESVRLAVRDMLRLGGYKPTGRGKPASEYLVRAAESGSLGPINAAVDACNAVSLHSGLPVSVIDEARGSEPYRIATAAPGTSYVFNAGGQEIDVGGLVCLHDAAGACANPVKDAQRTKTNEETRATLSVVWGIRSDPERVERATAWYRELLERLGATTSSVALT